jgi:glycosyltransferase involved in cell wall biosynthesis
VVVVSEPMGRFVARRIPGAQWLEAPTCVDEETFTAPDEGVRSWLTYVGSGAPWQGIDLLAPVWRAIADLDPTARFRVVSRDERARDLVRALAPGAAEMVAGATPGDVARMLWQSEVGFLVRRPGVVNETSFPTKFGEYVAAGVPVVTTDIGWEVSDIVRRTGCGVIVGVEAEPARVAREILDFRQRCRTDDAVREGCRRATALLARDRWIDELAEGLRRVTGR